MRSLAVTGIALLLVVFVHLLGTCGRSEKDAPITSSTTTSTAPTTTSTSTSTTTTISQSTIDTLPPVEGIGTPTLGYTSSITTVGLDTVHFGMTAAAAQKAAGTPFTPKSPVGDCYMATPNKAPEGITFWIVDGTVERVDIDTPEITTRSGAGIGNTEDRIMGMFGDRMQISPMPDGSGNLLAFVPRDEADKEYRVMFQSDGKHVVRLWSGKLPWVQYLDGCPTD